MRGINQWDHLAWIRELTRLPVILKGILHPDDARRAVEARERAASSRSGVGPPGRNPPPAWFGELARAGRRGLGPVSRSVAFGPPPGQRNLPAMLTAGTPLSGEMIRAAADETMGGLYF
jgi:hypothetical protein